MTDSSVDAESGEINVQRVRSIGSDSAALEEFYVAFYPTVVRYFARRVRDPHDVADLVADTFMTALETAQRYDPRRGRALAWLLGIAHNALRRFHRNRRADHQAASRLAGRRLLDAEDIALLEEQIDAEQLIDRVHPLLARLSTVDRGLLEMVDVIGLTPKEAASAMGLLPGTVRVRLFRVRAKLRAALLPQEDLQ